MKLSDYVAEFLSLQGVRHAFAIIGGASLHLIDSIARTPGIEYVCPQHEQAGAMAADAYSRATGNLGVAIATSGPGATNLITGIACSYFDSVPVLYLTGQVTTFRLKGDSGVRQMGFQETEIVDMVKPIPKYAVMIRDPLKIRYELMKAIHIAKSGRPGPVLVDIPDDLQRMDIDVSDLESFTPELSEKRLFVNDFVNDPDLNRIVELIGQSKRPVIIIGWGVRLAKAENDVRYLIHQLGIPVLLTWPMVDMMPSSLDSLVVGSFGTHGTRYANYALQNADFILSIGARLDTREAGSPYSEFGRGAKKIIVDIDPAELGKFSTFGMNGVELLVNADAGEFIKSLSLLLSCNVSPDFSDWLVKIRSWRVRYPVCPPVYYEEKDLNPYVFMSYLSRFSKVGDLFVLDTGCALAWMCQAFAFKKGQRLFHAFNTTPMGYGLPAAIGVSFAKNRGPVTCIAGDGGFQMNIQEMATVIRHNLPIRIFLINNGGYSMVRQTQDQWLKSRYEAVSVESGLAFPDFLKVAEAYGFKTFSVSRNDDISECLSIICATEGPVFCDVQIKPEHGVIPQVRFGRPLEDGEPFLDREEFLQNMIVEPTPASLKPTL